MAEAAAERPPGAAGAPKERKLSDAIPLEAVHRIAKLPVVESSINIANDMYSRVKESNSMINWTLSTAESTINKAAEHAIPMAEKMEKQLKRVDSLLCSSLDYVEAKVPAVKLPPHEILESTHKLVESKLQPALERASELKQKGAEKMHMDQLMAMVGQAWRLWRPLPPQVNVTPSTPPSSPFAMGLETPPPCPPPPPPTPASGLTPMATTPNASPSDAIEFYSPLEISTNLENGEEMVGKICTDEFQSVEVCSEAVTSL